MPRLVFSLEEIANAHLDQMRALTAEVLALSDLKERPLDPGESVAARHHKIAKLGKQLAQVNHSLLDLMERMAPPEPAGEAREGEAEPSPQAN